MGRKYSDNALTPLSGSISSGATTLAVGAGKGDLYPVIVGHGTPGSTPDYFVITMENAAGTREKIRVEQRAVGVDTLGSAGFPLVRGYDGTTPAAWNAGDLVDLRMERSGVQDVEDKTQAANRAFGIRGPGTSGLNFGYYGGTLLPDGVLTNIPDGAVALTASQTNFVERTYAGVVSANVTAFSADKIPLYTVTTDSSGITAFTDQRAEFHFAGRLSKSVAGAADVALSRAEAANEILELTGVLTGNINLILPALKREWIVKNNTSGAFSLTVKTAAGTGIAVLQGKTTLLYGDGTNIVDAITFLSSLSVGLLNGAAVITSHPMELRLSLVTGVPVAITDQTAKATVFLTPYKGGNIDLHDGVSAWTTLNSAEVSVAVPATTGTPFDIWARNVAGVVTLDTTNWTNDTTRATALAYQNGILVKSGDSTRRYLGTGRTTGVAGQTEDSVAKRFLWNYYNRVVKKMKVTEGTASWRYENVAYRQANANAANQLDMVIGVSEDAVTARVVCPANTSASVSTCQTQVGIGVDSTTVDSSDVAPYTNSDVGQPRLTMAFYAGLPGIGRHFLAWLEASETTGAGNVNFYSASGAAHAMKSGISGELLG